MSKVFIFLKIFFVRKHWIMINTQRYFFSTKLKLSLEPTKDSNIPSFVKDRKRKFIFSIHCPFAAVHICRQTFKWCLITASLRMPIPFSFSRDKNKKLFSSFGLISYVDAKILGLKLHGRRIMVLLSII